MIIWNVCFRELKETRQSEMDSLVPSGECMACNSVGSEGINMRHPSGALPLLLFYIYMYVYCTRKRTDDAFRCMRETRFSFLFTHGWHVNLHT